MKEYYRVAVNTPKPIDGALDGLKTLRSLGYRLVIVTARHQTEQKATQEWVDTYYPGVLRASILIEYQNINIVFIIQA